MAKVVVMDEWILQLARILTHLDIS